MLLQIYLSQLLGKCAMLSSEGAALASTEHRLSVILCNASLQIGSGTAAVLSSVVFVTRQQQHMG